MWVLRDLWDWMCPGYNDPARRNLASSQAAFVSYTKQSGFRDFCLELEAGSTPENPRVGLWAKAYMTTEVYELLGTILTRAGFTEAVGQRRPALQQREVSEQKETREKKVLEMLRKAARGRFRAQFSEARLSNAIAMCERRWDHFATCTGQLAARAGCRDAAAQPACQSSRCSLRSQRSQTCQRANGRGGRRIRGAC